jgi:hypothetical protein
MGALGADGSRQGSPTHAAEMLQMQQSPTTDKVRVLSCVELVAGTSAGLAQDLQDATSLVASGLL